MAVDALGYTVIYSASAFFPYALCGIALLLARRNCEPVMVRCAWLSLMDAVASLGLASLALLTELRDDTPCVVTYLMSGVFFGIGLVVSLCVCVLCLVIVCLVWLTIQTQFSLLCSYIQLLYEWLVLRSW